MKSIKQFLESLSVDEYPLSDYEVAEREAGLVPMCPELILCVLGISALVLCL